MTSGGDSTPRGWYICLNNRRGEHVASGPYANIDTGRIIPELRALGATFVWLSEEVPPGYRLLSSEEPEDGATIDALAHPSEGLSIAPQPSEYTL